MLLTEDQVMIRDAVRAFAQEQLWPNAARWDKEHSFPKEAHRGLAELGAYGICVPEELGGAGLDYVTLALVLEEIAAGDGGTSTAISVTNCPYNAILMKYGTPAQQQQWLVPAARGDILGAFCLTEPHVGSDASGLRTTAVREGDEYVINGVKQFITSGKNGQAAVVIAVTDKGAGKKGMSAFLVPTSNPGYVVARLESALTARGPVPKTLVSPFEMDSSAFLFSLINEANAVGVSPACLRSPIARFASRRYVYSSSCFVESGSLRGNASKTDSNSSIWVRSSAAMKSAP